MNWHWMSTVETQWAIIGTKNASHNAVKHEELTATVCNTEPRTVQLYCKYEAFNWTEQSHGCKGCFWKQQTKLNSLSFNIFKNYNQFNFAI